MITEKQLYDLGYIRDIITHGGIQNYKYKNFSERPYYVSWETDTLMIRHTEGLGGNFSFRNIKEFKQWHNNYKVQ